MDFYFILTGLVMIILAIPMINGKVPPNHWYGFRVRRTMDDPEVWYPANAYAGKLLFVYGIVIIAATLILSWVMPGLSPDAFEKLMALVLLGGIFVVVVFSWRFLRTI